MNNKNIKDALDRLTELSKDPEIVEAARQREMSGVLQKPNRATKIPITPARLWLPRATKKNHAARLIIK